MNCLCLWKGKRPRDVTVEALKTVRILYQQKCCFYLWERRNQRGYQQKIKYKRKKVLSRNYSGTEICRCRIDKVVCVYSVESQVRKLIDGHVDISVLYILCKYYQELTAVSEFSIITFFLKHQSFEVLFFCLQSACRHRYFLNISSRIQKFTVS